MKLPRNHRCCFLVLSLWLYIHTYIIVEDNDQLVLLGFNPSCGMGFPLHYGKHLYMSRRCDVCPCRHGAHLARGDSSTSCTYPNTLLADTFQTNMSQKHRYTQCQRNTVCWWLVQVLYELPSCHGNWKSCINIGFNVATSPINDGIFYCHCL